MDEPIYHRPEEYDLEHAGPELDIEFYVQLACQWRPRRILELGCGTGRVALPLAIRTNEFAEQVVGLELVPEMLQHPPRATLELDSDTSRPAREGGKRLLRYKAVRYDPREQCASVHFLYDEFQGAGTSRFLSDYEHHVCAISFSATMLIVTFLWLWRAPAAVHGSFAAVASGDIRHPDSNCSMNPVRRNVPLGFP